MYNTRYHLHIGEKFIDDALTSTRKLEAFSLAIYTKVQFRSSSYHNPNKNEISKVLQISTKKAQRIIEDCVSFGYARFENNNLIFKPISKQEHVTYRLNIDKIAKIKLNNKFIRKSDTNTRCISLEALKNEIRTIKILNKIQQKQFTIDTSKGFAAGNSSLAETKVMEKNMAKYAISTEQTEQGISIINLMQSINIKNRNKTIRIINLMVRQKLITKQRNIHYVGVCKNDTFYQSNEFGCFFTFKNKLYQVNCNSYRLSEKVADKFGRR